MSTATTDLYEILGVTRTATKAEIHKKYRKLARQHHPDVHPGDKDSERRFKEISAAHSVLHDDEKRKLYDEFGDVSLQSGFDPKRAADLRDARAQGRAPASDGSDSGWSGSQGTGGFDDLLRDLFAGRQRGGRSSPRPGDDVEADLELDFVTAVRGGTSRLQFRRQGAPAPETLDVTIPKGVRYGQRLRLAGLGESGRNGGPPGDLYVRVLVQPHKIFRRDGDDLSVDLPITVGEAIVGASVTVPSPTGDVTVKIPAGTQSGRRLRLRGMGVTGRSGPGDLYVKALVMVPTVDSPELRELALKTDALYGRDVRSELKL